MTVDIHPDMLKFYHSKGLIINKRQYSEALAILPPTHFYWDTCDIPNDTNRWAVARFNISDQIMSYRLSFCLENDKWYDEETALRLIKLKAFL